MELTIKGFSNKELKSDLLCLLVPTDGFSDQSIKAVDEILSGQLTALKRYKHFSAGVLEQHNVIPHPPQKFRRMLLVGLGATKDFYPEMLRKAGGLVGQKSLSHSIRDVAVILPEIAGSKLSMAEIGKAIVEGINLGSYTNKSLRSDVDGARPMRIKLLAPKQNVGELKKGGEEGLLISNLQNHCRDLSGCPSNIMTPSYLVEEARRMSRKHGLKVQVYDRKQIEKMGMGAFLAVAQGSQQAPYLIQLDYQPRVRAKKRAVVVGKGITFDTGGISIKPAENMGEMKQDMTGAAVVLCAMAALARFKPAVAITAYIPTCENMLSGSAYKPGDVVQTSIGKTIEIVNTDAEGRLLLADVLGHATKSKPDYLFDVATLTGAATVALGHYCAAILSTSEQLVHAFAQASNRTGEKVWELPLLEDYEYLVSSPIADMKNSGGKPAGTITAALILKKFTAGIPWLHLDIAAVDYEYRGTEYVPRGATGFGVRVLTEALRGLR